MDYSEALEITLVTSEVIEGTNYIASIFYYKKSYIHPEIDLNSMKSSLVIIVIVFAMTSCSKDNSNPEQISGYTVTGYLKYGGENLQGATVSLDNIAAYTTQTNSSGYFQIDSVEEGSYVLKATKTFSDSSFTEISSDVTVDHDLYLESLRLPKAVILDTTDLITDNSVGLCWSSSDATDFREYKLYRHLTPGLDETTGTLIYVATSVNDTSVADENLTPSSIYFYRVYVMNDFGRLGGSNIVSAMTKNYVFIWNGDFENTDSPLSAWWDNMDGKIGYTDSLKATGNYSLSMEADSANLGGFWSIYASMSRNFSSTSFPVEQGRQYKISGWIKTEGEAGASPISWPWGKAVIRLVLGNNFDLFLYVNENADWTYLEQTFTSPGFDTGWLQLATVSKYAWFDDVKLEINE